MTLRHVRAAVGAPPLRYHALLSALAQALFQSKAAIHSAHIATYGERAVDVFYLTDRDGRKIESIFHLEAIRSSLLHAALEPDRREAELSKNGFLAMIHRKNSDFAASDFVARLRWSECAGMVGIVPESAPPDPAYQGGDRPQRNGPQ